jgi:cation diffusion facilitator CzcD-associated flavoprotein CzcO
MRIGIFNKPEVYNERAQKLFTGYMTRMLTKLGREDLIEKVVPDYPVGCKRIAYSKIYLEGLARNNVVVERSEIAQVKSNSIVTENGQENEIDVLVLATGFITQDYMGPLQGKPNNTMTWVDNHRSEIYD